MAIAGSTVVIGTSELVRIHAHADDPEPLIHLASLSGSIDQLKVEDMDVMHQQFISMHDQQKPTIPIGVISIANGSGLERIFSELGSTAVVQGGQSMNPSTAELINTINHIGADHSIILPNNPNILMTAEQAVSLSKASCTVLPTTNIPQGIAAVLAMNPDMNVDANIQAMTNAIKTVQSGEITIATRQTSITGMSIQKGHAVGLLNGELICTSDSLEESVLQLLEISTISLGDLVTLYWGYDVTESDAEAVAGKIRGRWSGIEVDVVNGGQPHYHYLISIE
jgi:dihydroxyacetone kinase-like predicted kinase